MRRYTKEEKQWLKENIGKVSHAETVEKFKAMFSSAISASRIRTFAHVHGLSKNEYNPPLPRGAEKTMPDGYVYVKVCGKAGKGKGYCWKQKHRIIYEQANGKIPDGYSVIFLDCNRQNIVLDNLMLASRAEVVCMNKNGFFSSDHNVTRLGLAVARMRLAAARRIRESTTAKDLYQFSKTKNLGKFKNKALGSN